MASRPAYRPDIEGLRGVAVLLVILCHAYPGFLRGGFAGVDVFFVISGFLITRLILAELEAGTFGLARFYARRVRRIVPALLVVLAACCLFAWLTLLPSELGWFGTSLAWCVPFLANSYFSHFVGGYFDRAAVFDPLLHLWSLAVEEQFYLLCPLLLLTAVRLGVTTRVLLAVTATSLAISIWGAWYEPIGHFYRTAARAWELSAGGLLAAAPGPWPGLWNPVHPPSRRGVHVSWAHFASLAGLALIAAGSTLWSPRFAVPGYWSLLPVAGAVLVIAAGPEASANRRVLASGPVRFVGRISYPLYLWHWPALSFAHIFLGRVVPPALASAIIAGSVAAAWATYRRVEIPIRFGPPGRRHIPLLVGALAGCGLLGAALGWHRLPGRLTGPTVAAWDAASTDWHYPGETRVDARSGMATLPVRGAEARTVLFAGDSHAEQYWARVAYLVESRPTVTRSALFVTHSGCPPLPGVETERRGRGCARVFDLAMQRALQPDVDTVVFSAFWEEYFLGEYSFRDSRQGVYRVDDTAHRPLLLGSPGTEIAFARFQSTVARLVAAGRRVFIVLSNPTSPGFEPLFPARMRLTLNPPGTFRLVPGARIDPARFESFVAPLMERLRSIAAQTGARVVDPRTSLCAGGLCPTSAADGLPLYLDSNHLRTDTARTRAAFIDPIILDPQAASRGGTAPRVIASSTP